jgi:hypothetical protein
MGFNSQGAVQGGMQGASAGASAGGGWGALIGGVLGAAGGSQLPQGQGALPPPPYLQGYGTPSGVSSDFGGSYVDPYTGRIVYTSPGGDSSSMLQNMQYDSMLNQLLGIGGGGDISGDLDQQIKELQAKLAGMGDYRGVVADKYFGKDVGSALIDEKGNLKDFATLVNEGLKGKGGKRIYYNPDGTPWEGDHEPSAAEQMRLGLQVGNLPENQLNMDNPLVKQFLAQYQGKYGEGGDIADNWYRFVKDAKNNFFDKQNAEYEQARRADEGNQAVRKEQAAAIQSQLDRLTRAKAQFGQGGGQGGGNSLLGYLTNAPNIQRMEIQKNLSDANSMANQRAARMGMSFSSQNELAKGGNAINAAVAMNNANRQNYQDTMSMMDWLRGGKAQANNQRVQNAQSQLGFTGQGYGINTHQLDMEAQRQAAAAGLNTSYAFGQANLDSARQQAMMQGLGGVAQGLGSYYGSQSQTRPGENPQAVSSTSGKQAQTNKVY